MKQERKLDRGHLGKKKNTKSLLDHKAERYKLKYSLFSP